MNHKADYVVAFANIAMACATLYLACQARKQLVFMKKESELAKYPNVVLFLAGLFTKAKLAVEHHDGYDPHRFVFFNASDKSVVYLGGHLFKWSGNRPLTHRALKGLEAHYGDPDEGWLGFLNPRLSRSDAEGGGIPEAYTEIVEPSGSITLIPNDKDALSDFLRASVQGKTQHIILILVLAYPATPGGIVTVGAPFRIKASAPDGVNHDGGIIGEMIAEQLVYSSSVKEKNIEP